MNKARCHHCNKLLLESVEGGWLGKCPRCKKITGSLSNLGGDVAILVEHGVDSIGLSSEQLAAVVRLIESAVKAAVKNIT